MSNSKRKSTRVRVAQAEASDWWTAPNIEFKKHELIPRAKDVFGEPGIQTGRRWFYKTNREYFYNRTPTLDGGWVSVSRTRMFLDFYFKRPEDATWFQLKCMG